MGSLSAFPVFIFIVPFILNRASGTSPAVSDCVCTIPRCPPNEEPGCRDPCPPEKCITLYVAIDCIANQTCIQGCYCKKDFLRTSDGTCVPPSQCLPLECVNDPNAKRGCGMRCGKTCEDYNVNQICPHMPCKKDGCECKDGFVYDKNIALCVKPGNCTKQCSKPHERYSSCLLGECVPKTCADLRRPLYCPFIVGPCAGGCICEEGYVKDSKGNCIHAKKCQNEDDIEPVPKPVVTVPHKCPPNEVLKSSVSCPPDTCDTMYLSYLCIADQVPSIVCTCKDNYLRTNSTGACVPTDRCLPPECANDPHAIRGCGNRCKKTCSDYNDTNKICKNNGCKVFGCECQEGWVYDEIKMICVKPNQCTKQCKKPHERYSNCLLGECVPKTCDDLGKSIPCPSIASPCAGGCICKEGYVRDYSGDCIEEKKCPPPCKGPHEKYISCPAGQCNAKTCDNLVHPAPCPRIIPPCPGGCICEEGYLKDSKGICIEKNKCPQLACNSNQTYVSCNDNCPDKYCPKDDQPQPVCDPPRNCPPGCTCKINYRRDKSGKCILASECPEFNCTRKNEVFTSCSTECLAENCEDADKPPTQCNTLLLNCQPKCICKKDHFRNSDGRCVPAKDCPSVCKDPNAQWKDCKSSCPGTCQNTKPVCLSKTCTAGCECNEGYVLSKEGGKCVPIDTCGDYVDCGANQTFVPCTFRCPQVECPETDQTILCKPPRDCSGGCGCKNNYRYNANDECILGSDCPPVECTRKNQEWAPCRSQYDWERCDDRYNSPPFAPDDDEYCNPRCVCIKGHYKNNYDECVPESECPPIS